MTTRLLIQAIFQEAYINKGQADGRMDRQTDATKKKLIRGKGMDNQMRTRDSGNNRQKTDRGLPSKTMR